MITVVIVAVLAALAAPSLVQFVRASRLTGAANQFQSDLQLARREAIKRNGRVLVCPAGSTAGQCGTDFTKWAVNGWVVCYDIDENDSCDSTTDPILTRGALDSSIVLTGPTSLVKFSADGSQAGGNLSFTVTGNWSGAKSYTGSVTATGNIAMAKPS